MYWITNAVYRARIVPYLMRSVTPFKNRSKSCEFRKIHVTFFQNKECIPICRGKSVSHKNYKRRLILDKQKILWRILQLENTKKLNDFSTIERCGIYSNYR